MTDGWLATVSDVMYELCRLRRQGQQIGERLRAQSRGSPPKTESRSPPAMGGLSLTGSPGGSASKGALKEPGSSSTNRSDAMIVRIRRCRHPLIAPMRASVT